MNHLPEVWVVPTKPGRVACFERHPVHPGGSLFIHWDKGQSNEEPDPVRVYETRGVIRAMRLGALKSVLPPGKPTEHIETPLEMAVRELSAIPGVGESRAEQLYEFGATSIKTFAHFTEKQLKKVAEDSGTVSLSQLVKWHASARELLA